MLPPHLCPSDLAAGRQSHALAGTLVGFEIRAAKKGLCNRETAAEQQALIQELEHLIVCVRVGSGISNAVRSNGDAIDVRLTYCLPEKSWRANAL